MYVQRRLRSACASAQTDQNLCCQHEEPLYNWLSKMYPLIILIRLRECAALRKPAHSNILKILQPKKENFQIKNSDIFHISAQHIDCGYSLEPPRRGGSNEYRQSIF